MNTIQQSLERILIASHSEVILNLLLVYTENSRYKTRRKWKDVRYYTRQSIDTY